jgi:hypothetical protein
MQETAHWTGEPDQKKLRETLLVGPDSKIQRHTDVGDSNHIARLAKQLRIANPTAYVMIRMDDVVDWGPELEWIIEECTRRQMPLSLEVIPYLSNLTDDTLDIVSAGMIEVSQHGFAHLPQIDTDPDTGEFMGESNPPEQWVSRALEQGYMKLQKNFPKRFHGGFSPPYDGLPNWLPDLWKSLGGCYISVSRVRGCSSLPLLRMGVDLWNWTTNGPRPIQSVMEHTVSEIRKQGYAGIVGHPQLLANKRERDCFVQLLDFLAEANVIACTPRFMVEQQQHS